MEELWIGIAALCAIAFICICLYIVWKKLINQQSYKLSPFDNIGIDLSQEDDNRKFIKFKSHRNLSSNSITKRRSVDFQNNELDYNFQQEDFQESLKRRIMSEPHFTSTLESPSFADLPHICTIDGENSFHSEKATASNENTFKTSRMMRRELAEVIAANKASENTIAFSTHSLCSLKSTFNKGIEIPVGSSCFHHSNPDVEVILRERTAV